MKVALEVKPGIRSLLDVGSRDSAYFDDHKDTIICKGVDISPRSVEYARSKGRDVVIGDAADVAEIFKGQRFDLVLSCHSFEHLLDHERFLAGCLQVLDDNGILLIRMPDEGPHVRDVKNMAHTKALLKTDVIKLLKDAGFTVILDKEDLPTEIFLVSKKGRNENTPPVQ